MILDMVVGYKQIHLTNFTQTRLWINEYEYVKFLYMDVDELSNNIHLINGYYWVTHQIQLIHLELHFSKPYHMIFPVVQFV